MPASSAMRLLPLASMVFCAACVSRSELSLPQRSPSSGDRSPSESLSPMGDPDGPPQGDLPASDTTGASDPGSSDTDTSDAGAGDTATVGPDWHLMDPEQWPLVQTVLAAAAAAGSTGPTTTALVGDDLSSVGLGQGWTDCVLAENGRIYCIPARAAKVLEIDPRATPVTTRFVGSDLGTGVDKWVGGLLHADGRIYAMPTAGNPLLRIDPRSEPVVTETFALPAAIASRNWAGGTRGYDGKIYGFPSYLYDPVLVIDPSTEPPTITWFGDLSTTPLDGFDQVWGAGSLAPTTGKIYLPPYGAKQVAEIDPVAQTATLIGPELQPGIGDKWYGATLAGDGKIYAVPESATTFLVIDPSTDPVTISEIPTTAIGADGAVLASHGTIVSVPWNSGITYAFNPADSTTVATPVTGYTTVYRDWAGATLAPNGKIYAAPYGVAYVLEIDPHSAQPLGLDVLLGGYFNHY